ASKPANLVKRCGDSSVRIVLNMKLRVTFGKVAGVLKVAFPVKRWRASSALNARSARRFFVSCGISTKLGFGPLSKPFGCVYLWFIWMDLSYRLLRVRYTAVT